MTDSAIFVTIGVAGGLLFAFYVGTIILTYAISGFVSMLHAWLDKK